MEASQLLMAMATVFLTLLVPAILYPKRTYHWVMRKNYQYEITFGAYMMTPTEKVILNTILLLSLSLVFFAIVLYLPSHVSTISQRAFYYLSGHKSGLFTVPSSASSALVSSTSAAWTSATEALQRATESVAHSLVQSVTAVREEIGKAAGNEGPSVQGGGYPVSMQPAAAAAGAA